MSKSNIRLAQVAVGLTVVLCGYLAWTGDARLRHVLAGRWTCNPYYTSSTGSLTFLRGGTYATFQGPADAKMSEFGTWDVSDGVLVMIVDHGSSIRDSTTWTRIDASLVGDRVHFVSSEGKVNAVCKRVKADASF